jgi:hypothetical protein
MLNSILYLVVFALVIYAFAILVTPKNTTLDMLEDKGTDEVTDADFPQCEGNSECKCKNK